MFNIAEGGMEMGEMGEAEAPDDVETRFMNISDEDSENIHHLEETLSQYTGDSQVSQRERLKTVSYTHLTLPTIYSV